MTEAQLITIFESLGADVDEWSGTARLFRVKQPVAIDLTIDPRPYDPICIEAEIESAFMNEGFLGLMWRDVTEEGADKTIQATFCRVGPFVVGLGPTKLDAYCKAWAEYKGLEL